MGGGHFNNSIKPARASREHLVINCLWVLESPSGPGSKRSRGGRVQGTGEALQPEPPPSRLPPPHSPDTASSSLAGARIPPAPLRRTRTSAGATHSAAQAGVAAAGWRRQALSAPQAGPGRPSPGRGCYSCQRGSWPAPRSLGARREVPGA